MGLEENLKERLRRYLELTGKALEEVKVAPPSRSFLRQGGEDMLKMARSYYDDAKHFKEKGDLPQALAAVSYAHGWIDAGVRLGLLDGGADDQTFTQYS
jgi:hypothetical protein